MYTYQIKRQRVTPNLRIEEAGFLSKEDTLKRNIDKCWLVVGDRVKFKKPRRNPVYGTVLHIETDSSKVTWTSNGLVPMNIILDVEKVDHATKVVYGLERVKTNVKKIVYVSRKG